MDPSLRTAVRAQDAYERAEARATELRVKRDAAVLAALASGQTHKQVAAALDVSRGLVGQIAMSRRLPLSA
jgi:FixJ family two-component response regulator